MKSKNILMLKERRVNVSEVEGGAMIKRLLRIEPDGQQVTILFHDQSPLMKIGKPTIIRASHVKFDNNEKKWFVYLRQSNGKETKIMPGFTERRAAINYEISECEEMLKTDPIIVQDMVNKGTIKDDYGHNTSG